MKLKSPLEPGVTPESFGAVFAFVLSWDVEGLQVGGDLMPKSTQRSHRTSGTVIGVQLCLGIVSICGHRRLGTTSSLVWVLIAAGEQFGRILILVSGLNPLRRGGKKG